ncbi:MAG: 1-deoxy-D-xylulose-5-phosphate synthase [Planctomycetota bacterium]|nr:1-deoxy-D-xylulose-5-phosphate synthase [Planctomycetota bacterium]
MKNELLSRLQSPKDLRGMSDAQLTQLAGELREALCEVVTRRPAHFASNLGVVELAIMLHQVFDFSRDRLIWDTGHQIYPHKLLTGRYNEFISIRSKGGLMGYPNPAESDYDLFMTGHAGASVSTALGLKAGDDLLGERRHSVAVIGDGALPSGVVFEAFNNAAGLSKDLLVILNDNKMGICPRVGGLAHYLDRVRATSFYDGLKRDVSWVLNRVPLVGDAVERALVQAKEGVKATLHGGMLFEEMGFRYIGPIDGHDLASLREHLQLVKSMKGPVLLHVFTEKGHGFQPAEEDPVTFHAPAPFDRCENGEVAVRKGAGKAAYTDVVSEAIYRAMELNPKVAVMTAAMCEGNKLQKIRDVFPDRFFDTGICEAHAVAFAAGMAKAGARPIVDIYSTFLQRSFDHIFQEVALQNLPVVFCLDRAGVVGADGPTHHGAYDTTYMRVFPNMVVAAPGDEADVAPMLNFALGHDGPVSIRYPKANVERIPREFEPIQLGRAEVLDWGRDGVLIAYGTLLSACVKAAERLKEEGLEVGVINARFCKPIDREVMLRAISESGFVVTVEEGTLEGGFGSAVLEAANSAGLRTDHLRRIGLPDRYIEHAERAEQLRDLGLDVDGIVRSVLEAADRGSLVANEEPHG